VVELTNWLSGRGRIQNRWQTSSKGQNLCAKSVEADAHAALSRTVASVTDCWPKEGENGHIREKI
jgi:hypothetical protein